MVDRRVASARGGGAGGPTLYDAHTRLGDGGTSCISSSKQTFRRNRTGDSAKETLLAGGGVGVVGPSAASAPLYGGGALYGGAFRAEGFNVFE